MHRLSYRRIRIAFALLAASGACSGDDVATPDGGRFDAARVDAGVRDATVAPMDASTDRDAGAPGDSGLPFDAGDLRTYTTTFPLDENPIDEAGAWSALARPWLRVRTTSGVAKPDEYVTGYNDNYTRLSGFGPDVEITATVFISGAAPFGEILLLARMDDTASTLRGYEFLYDGDGNIQLMRWNGASGDFTPMGGEGSSPGPLADGDQIRMRVDGATIMIFHRRPPGDWVHIGEITDTTFADGQPGFGFFVRDLGQTIDDIGLHDYTVTELR